MLTSQKIVSLLLIAAFIATIVGVFEFHYFGHPPFILTPISVVSVLITAIVGTITGFGTSIILTPLFFLIFDQEVFLVSIIVHLAISVWKVIFFWSFINRSLVLWFAIPAMGATLIGSLFLVHTSLVIFTHILGGFLCIYGVFMALYRNQHVDISYRSLCIGGIVSGFLEGFFGIKDVIRSAMLLSYGMEPEVYIATGAAISVLIGSGRIFIYYLHGALLDESIASVLLFIAVTFVGVWIGKKLLLYIDQKAFTQIVAIAIALFGFYIMTTSEEIISIMKEAPLAALKEQ